MKWKSMFSVAFSFFLIMSIALGCSQTPTNSDTGEKEETGETVQIDFWYGWTGPEGQALEELITEFNESQDKIKVKGLSQSDYQKQLTAITGGNPPDVASQYGVNVASWGTRGAMIPLDDYITNSDINMDDFVPAALDTVRYDGTTHAIPLAMHTYMLYYNKDIFAEAGLDGPPETISEWQEYSEKLTIVKEDGGLERVGFLPDIDPGFYTLANVFGAQFWDQENMEVTPEDPAIKQAVQFAKNIWDQYGSENLDRFTSSLGQNRSPQDPFYSGRYAMKLAGEYEPAIIEKYALDLNYGVAPIPYDEENPDLKNAGYLTSAVLYIPKGAKHPDEAWEFLSWLTAKEQMARFDAAIGNLPTRVSALDDPAFDDVPGFEEYLEYVQGPNIKALPSLPFIEEYRQEIKVQHDAIMRGKLSIDEGLKKVKEKIQPLVEETMQ